MPDSTFPAPGGAAAGYLAVPAGTGPWPGVVVIHEAFGLTGEMRAAAWLRRGGGELRAGAEGRRGAAGRRLPGRGQLWRQGPGHAHRAPRAAAAGAGRPGGAARRSYQEHDAADAWERIYAFLGQYLS
ncbi:MAG TPA: dienelactone hydrolase family protein [Streptosporangiaceae bacterium]